MRVGALLLLIGIGCVTSERVVMLRREDGARAICGPYWATPAGFPPAWLLRACIEDYQRAGYERTPEAASSEAQR